jgi:uncharacterized phage protein (TIGR02216 family)
MGADRFAECAARLAGFAGLLAGWSPDAFWAATPAELRAVLEALNGPEDQPFARGDLARLMEMFPDG